MTKSKISKAILMSAAALSTGILLPALQASAHEPMSGEDYGQQNRYLDFDQFREAVSGLREKVAADDDFRAEYLANPRKVLTEAGLPVDLQLEIMNHDKLAYGPAFAASDCICTSTCLVGTSK